MTERIIQGDEDPAKATARRAAWKNRVIDPLPLTIEELYDMLELKGVLANSDRPRPKP